MIFFFPRGPSGARSIPLTEFPLGSLLHCIELLLLATNTCIDQRDTAV